MARTAHGLRTAARMGLAAACLLLGLAVGSSRAQQARQGRAPRSAQDAQAAAERPTARLVYLADPLWRPTGGFVAFLAAGARSDVGELWLAKVQGPALAGRLLAAPDISGPSWRPDGSAITAGADTGLWLAEVAGPGARTVRLTRALASETDWSPDGRWLVWVGFDVRDFDHGYVKTAEVTGHALGKTYSLNPAGMPIGPRWSPDGTRVLYYDEVVSSQHRLRRNLYVENRDGTGRKPVGSLDWLHAVWSGPQELMEQVGANRGGKARVGILRAGVDTGKAERVFSVDVPGRVIGAPYPSALWTRDRHRVLVVAGVRDTSLPGGHAEGGESESLYRPVDAGSIYVLDLDKKQATRLTSGPYDEDPAWSPDGSEIAFVRHTPGARPGDPGSDSLWVMKADGSGQRKILDVAALAAPQGH